MTINDRAFAYLRKINKCRNIRMDAQGMFEMESGANSRGDTCWFRIAYLASPSNMTGYQTHLIDVTGDSDRIMLTL
ncbi:MAG: hypothetical protein CMJ25_11465 [Phycisphaerae bacterium]|nr:hypothetical protein [Phycisphaerae bacterium]